MSSGYKSCNKNEILGFLYQLTLDVIVLFVITALFSPSRQKNLMYLLIYCLSFQFRSLMYRSCRTVFHGMLRGMGNGEWGMGNGEWGMGNGEWRIKMQNGDWGIGNGEWEIEMGNWNGKFKIFALTFYGVEYIFSAAIINTHVFLNVLCKSKSLDIITGESSHPALFLSFTTPEAKKLFKRI